MVSGHKVLFGMVKHQIQQLWFLLTILWCTQSGNHPKNNLPKFWLHTRYESKKKKWNPSYILGYLLELIIKILAIWIFFIYRKSLKSGKFESFLAWKILCLGHIFQVENWLIYLSAKETLDATLGNTWPASSCKATDNCHHYLNVIYFSCKYRIIVPLPFWQQIVE
jgi:hypothetical protein